MVDEEVVTKNYMRSILLEHQPSAGSSDTQTLYKKIPTWLFELEFGGQKPEMPETCTTETTETNDEILFINLLKVLKISPKKFSLGLLLLLKSLEKHGIIFIDLNSIFPLKQGSKQIPTNIVMKDVYSALAKGFLDLSQRPRLLLVGLYGNVANLHPTIKQLFQASGNSFE